MSNIQWYNLTMTSNTTPHPLVASASSELNTTYQAWKAFNGTFSSVMDCWHSNPTTSTWLQLDFGVSTPISRFKLKGRPFQNPEGSPSDFDLLGSNDGETFEILYQASGLQWFTSEEKEFVMNKVSNYRYYKLNINKPMSGAYVLVGALIFGIDEALLTFTASVFKNKDKYYTIDMNSNSVVMLNDITTETILNMGLYNGVTIDLTTIVDFYSVVGSEFEVITYTNNVNNAPMVTIEYLHPERKLATSPDVLILGVESINSITTNSSSSPLTVISFDNGSSWLSYENGSWVTVENAHQGMSIETLNSIPSEALTRIKGESNYIRFQHSFGNGDEISSFKMYVDFKGSNGILDTAYYSFDYSGGQLEVTLKKQGNYSIVYTDVDA